MSQKKSPNEDERLVAPTDRSSVGASFERLVAIMSRLRSTDGCPWDRAQDLASLRPYLIEETYEVLDAIDHGSVEAHREELGDLLLQVVFQAEIRRQAGEFDVTGVAHGISDKLVRRHPHVFGATRADGVREAYANWEKAKAKEKSGRSAIDGVPRALPSLLRAQRISDKAGRVGFDWPDLAGPIAKMEEELEELREALRAAPPRGKDEPPDPRVAEELGDLLLTVVNVARFLGVSAEDALRGSADRFDRRFRALEARVRASGRAIDELTLEELDAIWNQVKAGALAPT
ncbi:MAG: nucleoside triphosphate pyrophosphohydrolase [Deltaproteobacteria bacterium]|nr:nucleoside triphosphate pyrophosphohydrolase [Deltaproteobacteria bacterium]